MSQPQAAAIAQQYLNPNKNQELVLKLFNIYYRSHNHTGKIYEDLPDMFLVKPEVLMVKDLATRNSDKLLLDDCIQRALARNGYINVTKFYNAKLNYYWLELNVSPFMLGDSVTENNKSEFFYLLSRFVDYVKNNPKIYGDLTAELDSDKDLALMLKEINKMGDKLRPLLAHFPEEVLVAYNPKWPPTEVNKLLMALKGNELGWCEVFAESLIYVMGRKT
ncbi:MAG TPA: hypothetical protein VMV48_08360 [Gallionellaceae bacterium]|nr:hypothetical protein [Gallionellaceae bacterium]